MRWQVAHSRKPYQRSLFAPILSDRGVDLLRLREVGFRADTVADAQLGGSSQREQKGVFRQTLDGLVEVGDGLGELAGRTRTEPRLARIPASPG